MEVMNDAYIASAGIFLTILIINLTWLFLSVKYDATNDYIRTHPTQQISMKKEIYTFYFSKTMSTTLLYNNAPEQNTIQSHSLPTYTHTTYIPH